MNEERALTVSVDIRLTFEVEPIPDSDRDNFDIAAESAIADLRAHLARYSGGRVVSLTKIDKTV